MDSKTTPLILAIFTLVCALPAAGALLPAIAQEEETSLGEDLTRGTISDVSDGDADDEIDQDTTDTATVNSNKDQTVDQTDFNEFGDNTANLDADQPAANVAVPIATPTPPTPGGGLPPEGDVVFCFEEGLLFLGILCSDTLEECELVQEGFENVISECEGFETPPPGAAFCTISEGGEIITCELPD